MTSTIFSLGFALAAAGVLLALVQMSQRADQNNALQNQSQSSSTELQQGSANP